MTAFSAPGGDARPRWRRFRRLFALSGWVLPEVRSSAPARIGRGYPWIVFLVYGGLTFFARHGDDVPPPAAIVGSALAGMSWAAGFAAYGAARDRTTRAERTARLSSLSKTPVAPREERAALTLAIVRVVARAVGLPALCLALLSVLCAAAPISFANAVMLSMWVFGYAVVFGSIVGGIASISRAVSPRFGRVLFVLAIFGPYLVPSALGAHGRLSVVHGLSLMIDRVSKTSLSA